MCRIVSTTVEMWRPRIGKADIVRLCVSLVRLCQSLASKYVGYRKKVREVGLLKNGRIDVRSYQSHSSTIVKLGVK